MTPIEPTARNEGRSVRVQLLRPAAAASRIAAFEGVADLTDFDVVVGVEILDFRRQLDATAPASVAVGLPRWSYDGEMDAFYLHVADGTASAQRSVVGSAELDEAGHVLTLTIPGSL